MSSVKVVGGVEIALGQITRREVVRLQLETVRIDGQPGNRMEIELPTEELIRLAGKARRNRTGMAKDGAVRVFRPRTPKFEN